MRFDGEEKCSGQKGENLSIWSPAAFRKNYEGDAAPQTFEGGLDGTDGSGRILLIDADLAGAAEMPSDERVAKQLAFKDDAELKRQINVQDRNVEGRRVRGGV